MLKFVNWICLTMQVGQITPHKTHIAMPPKNGDNERARRAPPITTVQTANDHLALAKPKANTPYCYQPHE